MKKPEILSHGVDDVLSAPKKPKPSGKRELHKIEVLMESDGSAPALPTITSSEGFKVLSCKVWVVRKGKRSKKIFDARFDKK